MQEKKEILKNPVRNGFLDPKIKFLKTGIGNLVWGNVCGGNGMSVLPYAHLQLFKVFKQLIFV